MGVCGRGEGCVCRTEGVCGEGGQGGVSAGGVVVCGKGRGVPPFLRLRAVFGCIRPGMIGSPRRVKRHYVDGRRREHCQIQIVRNYPLVIFREPPLQGNSLGVFAETLIGLIPMEDKRLETHSHTRPETRTHSVWDWLDRTTPPPSFPIEYGQGKKNLHAVLSLRQYKGLQGWQYGNLC